MLHCSVRANTNPEERVRCKQRRWQLSSPISHPYVRKYPARAATPAGQARRALHNLHVLAQLTPPRVRAAALGTIWNRWTTSRRFQQRGSEANKCVLGCGATAEDSVEHYCCCPRTKEVAFRCLRLCTNTQVNIHTFTLCNPSVTTREDLTLTALLIYAVYRGTNFFRHHRAHQPEEVFNALRQWLREGALRHPFATRVLDGVWKQSRSCTPIPPIPARLPPPKGGPSKRGRKPGGGNYGPRNQRLQDRQVRRCIVRTPLEAGQVGLASNASGQRERSANPNDLDDLEVL